MSDPGYTHHGTDRTDVVWIGECDGCDLAFEIEGREVSADGEAALEDALADVIEGHEGQCGGTISWVRRDEPSETLTDGGPTQPASERITVTPAGIAVTIRSRDETPIPGYGAALEDLGLLTLGPEPLEGLEVVTETAHAAGAGYGSAILLFADCETLTVARERLAAAVQHRYECGDVFGAEAVEGFLEWLPVADEVQRVVAGDGPGGGQL